MFFMYKLYFAVIPPQCFLFFIKRAVLRFHCIQNGYMEALLSSFSRVCSKTSNFKFRLKVRL